MKKKEGGDKIEKLMYRLGYSGVEGLEPKSRLQYGEVSDKTCYIFMPEQKYHGGSFLPLTFFAFSPQGHIIR